MRIPLYQVDAFTSRLFGGNPAAVCPLTEWLPDETMQAIAAENNLAETAFFVAQGTGYLLRWFTPTVEVELCGHATLASGYVVTHILTPEQRPVRFDTLKAGPLEVTRDSDLLAMDFPAWSPERGPADAQILAALGKRPAESYVARPHFSRLRARRGRGGARAGFRRHAPSAGRQCDRYRTRS
jgi:PhzF family phenazine biosynthesis protein